MTTIAQMLEWGKEALSSQPVALLEAQILLAHALGTTRSYLYTWPDKELKEEAISLYQKLIARRVAHEPIAYILGNKEFWSLSFEVTEDTLIPRSDTELLVQTVLDQLPLGAQEVVDVGTGCGVIACTLAHMRPTWQLYGLDISLKALNIARKNAQNLNLPNVQFIQSNWLQELPPKQYDAIIGNPPYIRGGDVHLIHGDLPYEPKIALTPGPSGLEAFEAILTQCKGKLKPQGLIAFEHGFDQALSVSRLLQQSGCQVIQTFHDYSGNARVTIGRIP
jgi:release factor glutamine methyltransferase